MNNFFRENIIIRTFLVISVMAFFSFGFYHLAKFETVDEHFWKYERIGKYWKGWNLGITEGRWRKTRINDKPGVTTAIISGTGLLFEPQPETHRIRDEVITEGQLYTIYDSDRTERINLVFRLPLLIFNSLFLFFFFWIIRKITDSARLALLAVMFIALSPVLIGISQIINPDTLLWTFASAAIFSYFALLKTDGRKFLILTTAFTGLAILSKYTANILFPLYIIIFLSKSFIDFPKIQKEGGMKKYILNNLINFLIISAGAAIIYGLLLPAAFEKIKYLYRGTIGSPVLENAYPLLIIFIGILFADALIIKSKIVGFISSFFNNHKQLIFRITSAVVLAFFIFILINPWLNNPIIPLDDVKENAFSEKTLLFPMLDDYNPALKEITKVAIEMQPFVFSLLPIAILSIVFLWGKIVYKKLENFQLYIFIITIFTLIYFVGTLFSGVLANPRYSIMLYPLYAFLAAIGIHEIIKTQTIRKLLKKNQLIIISALIVVLGSFSLWNIKPFYLNYQNIFLPKEYVVTDAWGYGEYEAAQYLNSLPDAENLTIWSDRSAICQFIKGKCIRNYKMDLNKTVPEYFVFSRRGSIRHKFEWKYPQLAKRNNLDYYTDEVTDDPEWEIHIGGREKNFVKVIKTIEK